MELPELSVIIVNYNGFHITCECLRSILDNLDEINAEIILVDNASTECDPQLFLSKFPSIKLVRSENNGGFAYGNNKGIAASSGEYILLLNNDTIIRENSFTKCLSYARTNKNVGVIGCRMIYPNGKLQFSSRRFRSISWELFDLFRFILYLLPYSKRANLMLGKYFRHDKEIECDWLNGAFFLFPRKVLEKLPGQKLDERFFMYGEDQLWCEQVKALGYRNQFYAGTTIIHINSGSTSPSRQLALRRVMMKHELEIMRLRKGKGFYYYIFMVLFVTKESTRNLIKSVYFRLTGKLIR